MNVCEFCTEYNKEIKCENEKKCKLKNLEKENKRLKEKLALMNSYADEPRLTIGDIHEMGAW